jgi:hypothetical protein
MEYAGKNTTAGTEIIAVTNIRDANTMHPITTARVMV